MFMKRRLTYFPYFLSLFSLWVMLCCLELQVLSLQPQNHRVTEWMGPQGYIWFSLSAQVGSSQSTWHEIVSSQFLNISREGDCNFSGQGSVLINSYYKLLLTVLKAVLIQCYKNLYVHVVFANMTMTIFETFLCSCIK